jgi:serine/threonine-protein kinase
MGCVWIAEHLGLRTQVAVKFPAGGFADVPEAMARFTAEAAAAARIRHPHVAQVFDHGVSEGRPYIVMELLEGEDLAKRIAREGRVPPSETVVIASQVAKALERAHALGIVHRDIKPANVFLVASPGASETFVKVLDFGLAKHGGDLGGLTGSHAVFGSPHYVSPEQAESARAATFQADLWSLAVVVYECLTGMRPFVSDSLMGLCIALHEGRFTPPTDVCPDLPAALDAWCARAFQHDPRARFASATDLASALADAVARPPAASDPGPMSWAERDGGKRGRGGLTWLVAATCAVAVVLSVAGPFARGARGMAAEAGQGLGEPRPPATSAPEPAFDSPQPSPAAETARSGSSASSTTVEPAAARPAPASRAPPRPAVTPTTSGRRPASVATAPPPREELFADPKN